MKTTKTIISAIFSILFSLGLGDLSLPATAQQLDAPDLIETFPVGPNPAAMAFDGANIWVTSEASYMVTKLRASDGAPLGTFLAGGHTAYAVFDGTYIWVTNLDNDGVTRLRASDGAIEGSFAVGEFPLD